MAKSLAIAIAVACFCGTLAFPQENADKPSKYVWYQNAKINSGKAQVYSKLVSQFREATNASAPDMYWIAATPITGDSGRVTFVTFHDNMASIEKMLNAFDKVEHSTMAKNVNLASESAEAEGGAYWVLAQYREDLSNRASMVTGGQAAWWGSTLINLRPGCEYEFDDAVKQVISLHQKTKDNAHWLAYDIRAGAPEPSILFVSLMRSLAEEDQEPPAAAKELFESPLVRQMFARIGKDCIQHIETTYSRAEPKLSRPAPSMVAANPDFWTVKEETIAAAPPKTKKGAVQPAALKEKDK
jgi:hypothetical protein